MRTGSMGTWFAPIAMVGLYVAVLIGAEAVTAHRAFAADCDSGSTEERVACLSRKVVDLEAKVDELTRDTLKWNDRIALRNEDMRIFPRCLEIRPNTGPHRRLRQFLRQDSGSDMDDRQALSIRFAPFGKI